MRVCFVSNYINHHQIGLCKNISKTDGVDFRFIQTMPMETERIAMGWARDYENEDFVMKLYEDEDTAKKFISESDIIVVGWCENDEIEELCLKSAPLAFRMSERIYRDGRWRMVSPKGLIKKYNEHIKYRKSSVYLLCTGAYVAGDFRLIGAYPAKKLRWGYFPSLTKKSYDELTELKNNNSEEDCINILWVGRMLPLKNPDYAIYAAKSLKKNNIKFKMKIIGEGISMNSVQNMARRFDVLDEVEFLGKKTPGEVMDYMEKSHVLLFTSDKREGWGAVVNEAMGCGMVVVGSKSAGSVPFLIRDKINGRIYSDDDRDEFIEVLNEVCSDRKLMKKYSKEAYKTVNNEWNEEVAVERVMNFAKTFFEKGESAARKTIPDRGPFSIIKLKN